MTSSVHLKLELAIRGIRLARELRSEPWLASTSGARDFGSRDLELVLPGDVVARCPIGTSTAARSPFELRVENDRFHVARDDADRTGERVEVSVVPPPAYYGRRTRAGTPMWQIGTVHAGYVSIDPATSCGFAARGAGCQFCTVAGAGEAEVKLRSQDEVLQVVEAAFEEGVAEFVYFNTGYFDSDDGGFAFLEPYVAEVKRRFDTLVAVQVHPPRRDEWIDRTYAAGADALSYAVEIYEPEILARVCRGRSEIIGRDRYWEALAYAARVFPSGTVWSDLIVGLEPPDSTRKGIDALTAMGVLPVLSLFRPLDETALRDYPLPDPGEVAPLYAYLYKAVRDARINVQHMRDLGYAITPFEARFFAGDEAKLDAAVSSFYRSPLGGRAVRALSRLRRRLRSKRVSDSFDSSKL